MPNRAATGSAESRRLRAAGRIPAVVYGHGVDGISVSVDGRELRHALSGDAGLNQLLSLTVGSDTHLAMARSLQRHPVRHTVLHVDFQIVRRDEVISAEVPVIISGESKAVEQENGIVEQLLTSLTVNATPGLIPSNIEVDISELAIGEGIRVGDLGCPTASRPTSSRTTWSCWRRLPGPRWKRRPRRPRPPKARRRPPRGRDGRRGTRGRSRRGVRLRGGLAAPPGPGPAPLPISWRSASAIPGASSPQSRHNAGADTVALIAARHGESLKRSKEHALVAEVRVDGKRLALAFPQTYMNDSGRAVSPLVRRFGIDDLARLVVVHDELDLPLGVVRVKSGGGLAGHNGLRSIKAHLHSDAFTRVRIGIGKPPGGKEQGADHVFTARASGSAPSWTSASKGRPTQSSASFRWRSRGPEPVQWLT